MVRILVAAQDNHQITAGTVTGVDRARLKRRGDPTTKAPDGVSFGSRIEDTVADTPGTTPHDEWRHPVTDAPMSINPKFYIIEATPMPFDDPGLSDVFKMEMEPHPDPTQAGRKRVRQKAWFGLVFSGPGPNSLTPDELNRLLATHYLDLPRGRTMAVFQRRPEPS